MELTGGEIIAEYLIKQKVPYVIGIPGHGCLALADAFLGREDRLTVLMPKQEMSGVHIADGYYRVTGRPLAVFTSIGPGAINTAIGVATCFVDSAAALVFTGDAHTHMRGHGLLQEIERTADANFARIMEPIVKRYWRVDSAGQLPTIMARAFNIMLSGRPGPVLVSLPMNVQADSVDAEFHDPATRAPRGLMRPDPAEIERAAALLKKAKRPVILAGGGIHSARAYKELQQLAEATGAAVVATMQGKGCFPEDHPLFGWHTGSKGTSCGLRLTSTADVILAVGCRFADETASSYRHGVSFSIPPTKLIHIDIDPAEIGKNYPAEVGIAAHARPALAELVKKLKKGKTTDYTRTAYFKDIQKLKAAWFKHVDKLRNSNLTPPTISRALKEIRDTAARDAYIVTSSGNVQAQMLQEFPFPVPGTCITTGGFSTMGWTLPAALGVKLAKPRRQVIGIVGDGDFMMTLQELHTAVQHDIRTVMVVLDNQGWIAIKDLQQDAYGEDRASAVDFTTKRGDLVRPDFRAIAEGFGCYSESVGAPADIGPALDRCLHAGKPAVLHVNVWRDRPLSGSPAMGWWDVPIPAYLKKKRENYEKGKKQEKL